jgi:WavE lipopolysaccharide synthesis
MKSLTVIVQGGIHPNQAVVVAKFKQAFPFAQVVVSTWQRNETLAALADDYVISTDPGGFDLIQNGRVIRTENINRQIVSTRAGLDAAKGEWSLKWRADFDFDVDKMRDTLSRYAESMVGDSLLVLAYHTANPFADVGLVGHVSDWMYFAKTDTLRRLITANPIPATPEHNQVPHDRDDTKVFPFASFSCEQLMLRQGLQSVYGIPMKTFGDPASVSPFLSLIGKQIFVEQPSVFGIKTEKYNRFIYFSLRHATSYAWYRLASISKLECRLNQACGTGVLNQWLKSKALLSRTIDFIKLKAKNSLNRN